ncbi:MAG: hypothetical protein ABW321_06785 [Polyangiales bacterium]
MRQLTLVAALLLPLLTAASVRAEPCTPRDVVRGHFNDQASSRALCPLPSPTELVTPEAATVLTAPPGNGARAAAELLEALRTLSDRARGEPVWGAAFADHLDALLDGIDPRQCEQPWEVGFSSLRAPAETLDGCQCAFEVGSDGAAGHACYRFLQPTAAERSCEHPRVQLYDLPDWPAAARAFEIHQLARAALVHLGTRCRVLVATRLASAETRWQRLVTQGYVQYPWELWLSRAISDDYGSYSRCFAGDASCTGDEGLDPEPLRPIFLHPGVGLGFPGFGKRDGDLSAQGRLVIAVEAIGVNWYLDEFRHYLGASALVGFQDADFARPRVGLSVHLSRYLQVGYLWGFIKETTRNGTVYVSVDLLGFVNRAGGWMTPPTQ